MIGKCQVRFATSSVKKSGKRRRQSCKNAPKTKHKAQQMHRYQRVICLVVADKEEFINNNNFMEQF